MKRLLFLLPLLFAGAAFGIAVDAEGPPLPGVVALESNVVAEILILFGCVFILVSSIGLIRFPDVYTRLHNTTKLVAIGGLSLFAGAAMAFLPVGATERVLLIGAFFILTAPVSGYMVARSSYLMGVKMYSEEGSVDMLGLHGERAVQEEEQPAGPKAGDSVG